ncbi:MAG: cytochrome c biogenesis protein ResB [Chloroflexia bacterium]
MEPKARLRSIARQIWGFLASRRLSTFLFLAATAFLLPAAFFPQPSPLLDVAARAAWWEEVQARFGERATWLVYLGWLDVGRSVPLRILALALLANGIACTVDRLGRLWRAVIRRTVAVLPDDAYERASWRLEEVNPGQLPRSLKWLREAAPPSPAARYFYGERFRVTPFGTVVTHLGLLFLLAAVIAHATAARQQRLLLEPGTGALVTIRGSGCHLALAESGEEAPLVVYVVADETGTQRRMRLGPAHPGRACGARLYLETYGLAWKAKAISPEGERLPVAYPESAQWLHFDEGRTAGTFSLPTEGITGTVIPSPAALSGASSEPLHLRLRAADGAVLFDGAVEPVGRMKVGAVQLEWQSGRFARVRAVTDPGFGWLVAGGSCLVVGTCLVLWCRTKRVWARWTLDGVLLVRTAREAGK